MNVNRWDLCVPGMELFRCRDEFIISACVNSSTTAEDLLEWLFLDIDSCEREADFDYAAARKAVHEWVCHSDDSPYLMKAIQSLDYDGSNPDWAENCCCLFLYMVP